MRGYDKYLILLMKTSLVLGFAGLSLSGCSVTRVESKPPRIPLESWSLLVRAQPIGETSAVTRHAASAVGMVRLAEGTTASGFFVSPDGVFVTSYHAVTPSHCDASRCPSVQIVRDFSPDGEVETFTQVRPLAFFPSLDVSLLQVDLPSARGHLPFLSLASGLEKNREGVAIAHPFAGSAHLVRLGALAKQGTRLVFSGAVLPGMSGGPVIAPESRIALGVVRAVIPDLGSASKTTGMMRAASISTQSAALKKAVGLFFPKTLGQSTWTRVMFEDSPVSESERLDRKHVDPLSLGRWINEAQRAEWLRALEVERSDRDEFDVDTLLDFLDRAVTVAIATGQGALTIERLLLRIERTEADNEDPRLRRARRLVGMTSAGSCVGRARDREQNMSVGRLSLSDAWTCLSTQLSDGSSMLDRIYDSMTRWESKKHRNRIAGLALETVRNLSNYRKLNAAEREKALAVLSRTVGSADTLRDAFESEGLWTLLMRAPEQLGPETFNAGATKSSIDNL